MRAVLAVLGQIVDIAAKRPSELLEAAALRLDVAALPRALEMPCPQY